MTITKLDIIDWLLSNDDFKNSCERNRFKKPVAKQVAKDFVEGFFEEIRVALASGDDVKLANFGNFELRNKLPRPGRNPKTGEVVPVSARRIVTFKPGQKLRLRVENTLIRD